MRSLIYALTVASPGIAWQPRNQLVCFNCGRLEVTIRMCPRCGPTHSTFLAERKEAAATAAAQTRELRTGANLPRVGQIATLSVAEAASAEAPAKGRKKCRRSKKKSKTQQTTTPQSAASSQPPAEPQPSTSRGTTFEKFCQSLKPRSPRTRLRRVWKGEQVSSSELSD